MRADPGPRRFEVWAPIPERVEVEVGGTRHALRRDVDDWWRTDDVVAAPGDDYWFVLEGQDRVPDPRSGWQPEGVHGPSRVVDPTAFEWTDDRFEPAPLGDAVIYELHVGTFTPGGRFADVAGRLGHLVELGVTHVMPVAAFPGQHGWGYDGVALWAPHAAYGTPDDLRSLVDQAHASGLAVLLDVVYNHLGPEGNHLSRFGPYFTDHHRTPWGDAVNLDDEQSPEVRRFIVENALMWLRDHHLDGLRLDAVHALRDDSARPILEELAGAVDDLARELGRPKVLVAESDRNDPWTVAPRPSGAGLDAQWADDLHHGLHVALTGERTGYYADFAGLADVAAALERGFVYDGRVSPVRRRVVGRPLADVDLGPRPADRLVTCLDNHDQVGNRAAGERTNHLVGTDRFLVGATLAITAPTVPLIFQGEEWAASAPFLFFADHGDAELVAAVRSGRVLEFAAFGWDPDAVPDPESTATFERSRLDWSEVDREPHRRVRAHYRALLALRRTHPSLHDGRLVADVALHSSGEAVAFRRGDLLVAANLGPELVVVEMVDGRGERRVDGLGDSLVSSGPASRAAGGLHLGPDAAIVAPAAGGGSVRFA